MTHDQFEALVARLEAQSRQNPGAYRFRVIALALAGYGYLAFILALLAFLFLLAVVSIVYLKALGVKIAIAIGVFLWAVMGTLWVKLSAPQGLEVRSADAPALFAMIEGLRRKLRS